MAGSSLLMLLDDIAAVLDDVAVMTKVAAKKTAGVLGDDLALNAQQVAGIRAERELPVVWAVTKGSFKNKLIQVPAALLISLFIPWLIAPLLILGGIYLCFEGVEKLVHSMHTSDEEEAAHVQALGAALDNPAVDMLAFEQEKIKGAIRTDFVLSAEIIVITLGTVANSSFLNQFFVVSSIAILMTFGVYGFVAFIVKLDDIGIHLCQQQSGLVSFKHRVGNVLVSAAPKIMKLLSVVGTLAVFMVGGGILVHNIELLHHAIERVTDPIVGFPLAGFLRGLLSVSLDALVGVLAGAIVVAATFFIKKVWGMGQK